MWRETETREALPQQDGRKELELTPKHCLWILLHLYKHNIHTVKIIIVRIYFIYHWFHIHTYIWTWVLYKNNTYIASQIHTQAHTHICTYVYNIYIILITHIPSCPFPLPWTFSNTFPVSFSANLCRPCLLDLAYEDLKEWGRF